MHPRTRELLDYLDRQRAVFRAAFDAVPPGARERKPAPDRWSVAQVVEHVALVELRVAGMLAARIAEGRSARIGPDTSTDPILPTLDLNRAVDRTNRVTAPETAQPRGMGAADAWSALERAGDLLRGAVKDGDGLALGVIAAPHPLFGPLSLYEWIAIAGAHEARHAAQIREIAGQLRAAPQSASR